MEFRRVLFRSNNLYGERFMNKQLLAVALASAVALPATAMAGDLTVYGQAQIEVSNTSFDKDNESIDSVTEVADNARGRVGFKATEDLGGKLKGIAKMEFKVDTADGDADAACKDLEPKDTADPTGACKNTVGISITKREMMVGLKGVFGQFEGGRLKTPYKYTGGVKYDPFVATALEARGTAGMSGKTGKGKSMGHNGFHSNMLGWRSPNWGGFDLQAIYGVETDDGSYSVAAKWSIPVVELFVAANDDGDLASKTVSYSAVKAGGQVRLGGGNHKISLQYEMTDLGNEADKSDPTHLFLGYDGKFGGKTHFVAQLGFADHDNTTSTANDSYAEVYYSVGAIYKFSKQTRVFGGFRITGDDIENENNASMTWSVGIRKDFKS